MAGKLQNLKAWINSIIGNNIKVILIHDFQDTDTSKELNELIDSIRTQQIVLLEKHFGSPGLARNAGLALADTKWCCFWDSDDVPNIEKTMSNIDISRLGTEVIISNFEMVSGQKSTIVKHYSDLNHVALNPGLWRMVFQTELVKGKKFLDLRMGEDQIFLLDIDISKRNVEFSKEITYSYITDIEGQLTNQANLNSLSALSIIEKSVLNANYTVNRFLSIVYLRLFLSALKRLRDKYPRRILIGNIRFIMRIKPSATIFLIKSLLFQKNFLRNSSEAGL
jgi:glycosyltransferase involved in cell wall biosynthesis